MKLSYTLVILLNITVLILCSSSRKARKPIVWKVTIATVYKCDDEMKATWIHYTANDKEYSEKIDNWYKTIVGEKYMMRYNPDDPKQFTVQTWHHVFVSGEKTHFVPGMVETIMHRHFLGHFHATGYSYSLRDSSSRVTKWIWLPDNYKKLYPNLKKGQYYYVQVWDSNTNRIALRLDSPIHAEPVMGVIGASLPTDSINLYKPGALFRLDVQFDMDRHTLQLTSLPALENLYALLNKYPSMRIIIEGHVCCIKNAPDALDAETLEPTLSTNRAKAVYEYLINKGIERSRLSFIGFGKSRPAISDEKNKADGAVNRRVEIRITE